MQPLLVNTRDARFMLGIGNTKLYQLINEGHLETVKLGRKRLITVNSANRLIEKLSTAGRG